MLGTHLFDLIQTALGAEAHRHRGVDAPGRRDTVIAGGSYRAPGALVDGFRAGDADREVTGVVVAARASTAVLERAKALGANIVISRQAFLGDSQDRPVSRPEPALAQKIRFINENQMAVLRLQDPRIGALGRRIACALPLAIGLERPVAGINLADGLVYAATPARPAAPLIATIRKLKAVQPSHTFRLVGDPQMAVKGIACALETSRPNALAPLISRPDVNLLVAGEVHETETTAYVMDAIAMGSPKALLLIGSIAMEELPAKALAKWLGGAIKAPVHYVPTPDLLHEVA